TAIVKLWVSGDRVAVLSVALAWRWSVPVKPGLGVTVKCAGLVGSCVMAALIGLSVSLRPKVTVLLSRSVAVKGTLAVAPAAMTWFEIGPRNGASLEIGRASCRERGEGGVGEGGGTER